MSQKLLIERFYEIISYWKKQFKLILYVLKLVLTLPQQKLLRLRCNIVTHKTIFCLEELDKIINNIKENKNLPICVIFMYFALILHITSQMCSSRVFTHYHLDYW